MTLKRTAMVLTESRPVRPPGIQAATLGVLREFASRSPASSPDVALPPELNLRQHAHYGPSCGVSLAL